MKAPKRKTSSCMALLLRPLAHEGKRQAVAFGNPRHRVDMAVAQALDETLIVAGFEAQILGRQPAPGEYREGFEIGHAAKMRRLVIGAEQFGDLKAVAAMAAIGGLDAARRERVHEELAAELGASRPIGPAQLEDEVKPFLDDGGRR